ncbi:copper-binding protein [Herbaspirillum sp. GCM10030257]|uniref:copper-binding protein n=1 Tax=Herbaspirillum sp. GCM10030257 TaxID=3273393 RepID=UPI00361BE78E
MNSTFFMLVATAGFAILAFNASAAYQGKGDMGNMGGMKMDSMENSGKNDSPSNAAVNEGEVKAIDKAKKNITLKHGPVKSKTVEMTPMTMTFPVKDPSMLSKVKVGDKVKFNIDNLENTATVTSLQVKK